MIATTILGGVGLFLLGMALMSEGLKSAAGDSLRAILSRFTGGRFSAVASGAAVTAVVQSSSATTLATIGFVSAGLLTFPQAVGVILGANLGTTSTGWLVSVLGFKVQMSAMALPLVGAGALAKILLHGRWSAAGTALAGFGLIFIGIDVLQTGMAGLAERIDPRSFPDATLGGRLLLVLIGVVMTVVMQSSSAAVATTLAALHAGAISLEQAAALVVGQNVGTTVKAALVSIGGSTAVRRTAIAHILFNLVTGAVAFVSLPLFIRATALLAERMGGHDPTIALAAFHTAFNVLGVALFFPWIDAFARLVSRLAPERGPSVTRFLDRSVAAVPQIAVEAARRATLEITDGAFGAVRSLLRAPAAAAREAERDLDGAAGALGEVNRFIAAVSAPPEADAARARYLSTLHAVDHLARLLAAAREPALARAAVAQPGLQPLITELVAAIDTARAWIDAESPETGGAHGVTAALAPGDPGPAEAMRRASETIAAHRRTERARVLQRTAAGEVRPDAALRALDAIRWLDRVAYHAWRITHHLQSLAAPSAPPGAAQGEETWDENSP